MRWEASAGFLGVGTPIVSPRSSGFHPLSATPLWPNHNVPRGRVTRIPSWAQGTRKLHVGAATTGDIKVLTRGFSRFRSSRNGCCPSFSPKYSTTFNGTGGEDAVKRAEQAREPNRPESRSKRKTRGVWRCLCEALERSGYAVRTPFTRERAALQKLLLL